MIAKLEIKLQPAEEKLLESAASREGLTTTEYARRHLLLAIHQPAKTYETRTPAERAEAFLTWADSHKNDTEPLLSDEAISRESIYDDRGL